MSKSLDHVVVAVPDLEAAGAEYSDLGFSVTARSDHPFGTSNRLIMLPDSYVELVAVTSPELLPQDGFANFVAAAAEAGRFGPIMIVLSSDDTEADRLRLESLELAAPPTMAFSRDITLLDGTEAEVAFETAYTELGDDGFGAFYCKHLTPELMWRPETLRHPNGASKLAGIGLGHGQSVTLAKLGGMAETPVSNHRVDLDGTAVEVGSNTLSFLGSSEFEASVGETVVSMASR